MLMEGGSVPCLDVVPTPVLCLLPNGRFWWLQIFTHEVQWIVQPVAPRRRRCRGRGNGKLFRIVVVLMWVRVGWDRAGVVVGATLLLKLGQMLLQSLLSCRVGDLVDSRVELKVRGCFDWL